jgi:aminoglycoside phosphotransferase
MVLEYARRHQARHETYSPAGHADEMIAPMSAEGEGQRAGLGGSPDDAGPDKPVPPRVAKLAAGRPVREVWENEVGGRTFEVGGAEDRYFIKWTPSGSGIDLAQEATRLEWAAAYITVPRVFAEGADDTGSWLVTSALPGQNAVTPRWLAEPATAVAAIGEGLRAMHEAMPVTACPFSWMAEHQLADARRRAELGHLDPAGWHPVHHSLSTGQALDRLADVPPVERMVVCHGDACAPNTLITDDGRCSGHVDFGQLGVADRWADLAVATWSVEWNYGAVWEEELLSAYGVAPDPDRTRYYRLLWDLGP